MSSSYLDECCASNTCFLCGCSKGGGNRWLDESDLQLLRSTSTLTIPSVPVPVRVPPEVASNSPAVADTSDKYPLPAKSMEYLCTMPMYMPQDNEEGLQLGGSTSNSNKVVHVPTMKTAPICWSGCPASTRFLTLRARVSLDNRAGAIEGDDREGSSSFLTSSNMTITNEPFDLGFLKYDPNLYEHELHRKRDKVVQQLGTSGITLPIVETFESPRKHFRQRCRLGVHVVAHVHTESESGSASAGSTSESKENRQQQQQLELTYLMWNAEGVPCYRVQAFPIASALINALLQPLKIQLEKTEHAILLLQLSAIHFLSTQTGDSLIILVYENTKTLGDKRVEEQWRQACVQVTNALLPPLSAASSTSQVLPVAVPGLRNISFIATSKGVKLVHPEGTTYVEEELTVQLPPPVQVAAAAGTGVCSDGQIVEEDIDMERKREIDGGQITLKYRQPFDGFSNPNAAVNEKCLGWLCNVAAQLQLTPRTATTIGAGIQREKEGEDLLELYCGAGNHTCALSRFFPHIVAVELNKSLCIAAQTNLSLNQVTNVKVIAMHSESFARKVMKTRSYVDRKALAAASAASASAATSNTSSPMSIPIPAPMPTTHYYFGTVLVDPPRAGLDAVTRNLLRGFDRIIYISCCPESLVRDLRIICYADADAVTDMAVDKGIEKEQRQEQKLEPGHVLFRVERFAVFDHFAYSKEHLESAVLLVRL